MIVEMRMSAAEQDIQTVVEHIEHAGCRAQVNRGLERTVIGVFGDVRNVYDALSNRLTGAAGVMRIDRVSKPYKKMSREVKPQDSSFYVGDVLVGGPELTIIAGPCAVESEDQTVITALAVKSAGARILRGGAYKPRTSPYSFEGLRKEGLRILAVAKAETNMPVISEVMDPRDLDEQFLSVVDILQIGTRNGQNFSLLKEAGKTGKPVMVKRPFGGTCEEWISAAEHVMDAGSEHVIMCARGIRTFERELRFTPDTGIIPYVRQETHAPVFFDPSHAVGIREFVIPTALAAVVEGAQGIMVDVHPNSAEALCDGAQAMNPQDFQSLVLKIRRVRDAITSPSDTVMGILDIDRWPASIVGNKQEVNFFGESETIALTHVVIARRKDFAFPGYDINAISHDGSVVGYFKESREGWIKKVPQVGLY